MSTTLSECSEQGCTQNEAAGAQGKCRQHATGVLRAARALSADLTLHLLIYPRLRPLIKTSASVAARADVAELPAAVPASAAAMLGT